MFLFFQTGIITLVDEVYNEPQQLWSRVTNVENTQFALKNGDLYLTAQMTETGFSSLKVEEANYSNKVVAEYLELKEDGECCIPSQTWKRKDVVDIQNEPGYFYLENTGKENMPLTGSFQIGSINSTTLFRSGKSHASSNFLSIGIESFVSTCANFNTSRN